MRAIATLLLCGFALFTPAAHAADPPANADALLLPTYIYENHPPLSAGFATIIEEEGQRLAITPFHVFGPAGGMKVPLTAREIPKEVKALAGVSLGDNRTVLIAQPALYLEGARVLDEKGGDKDLAVFRVVDSRVKSTMKLADSPAKVGDRVWLLARLMDRAEPAIYAAKVVGATTGELSYRFENGELNLRACSGAPVLSEKGEVVGMHLGFQISPALQGSACPAAAVRARIAAALGVK